MPIENAKTAMQQTCGVLPEKDYASRSLRNISLRTDYRTSSGDLLRTFYIPCLQTAIQYDRAAGYFSSALFSLVGVALSDFVKRGGRMRLVCSPNLSEDDVSAIQQGLIWRSVLEGSLLRTLDFVLATPQGRRGVELLAALVALGCLEVKLAFRPKSRGLFHDKVGLFKDSQGDCVSFRGSANETLFGWDYEQNHEGFDVFCSWLDPREATRVHNHSLYFENLWLNREPNLEVCDFPDVVHNKIQEFRPAGSLEEIAAQMGSVDVAPQSPRRLMPHQLSAIESWLANGNKGIIKHATGAGKTLTAIEIIRKWLDFGRPALVIVPTEILLNQWREELEAELGYSVAYLQAGAGETREKWRRRLPDFSRALNSLGPRVTLSTLDTASSDSFLQALNEGDHLLVVIDEVHRVGAPFYRRLLSIKAGGRLGLSATPERQRDPHGTHSIFDYFGGILTPEFSLADAIRVGRLVPYEYSIHEVRLTEQEQGEWSRLSGEIAREWAQSLRRDRGESEDVAARKLDHLLIMRSKILKRAERKVPAARRLLVSEFREGSRWLVYCDDREQLEALQIALGEAGIRCIVYYSGMDSSSDESLVYFKLHGGIVLAIKCLDEGVDFPLADHALLIASSTNLREFIQRRGRVLRKTPDKGMAFIHDLIVLPAAEKDKQADEQYRLVASELRRAAVFASTAINRSVQHKLDDLASRFGLLITGPDDEGFESDTIEV